ncbi:hypothetical protein ACNKF0_17205 [Nocardioides sp. T5]|uniref:hypothetical protein n=1 Tax=Nocardioides sp. T5 TaxID=3400182 RepID=UPI003A8670C5
MVGYGLGNFVWYHDRQAATGVLTVTLDGGGAMQKSWTPARISPVDGRPVPLAGPDRARAVADFRARQRCTGLAGDPGRRRPTTRRTTPRSAASTPTSTPGCAAATDPGAPSR